MHADITSHSCYLNYKQSLSLFNNVLHGFDLPFSLQIFVAQIYFILATCVLILLFLVMYHGRFLIN